mmetsp:Transcript_11382/g.9788  ORF Transcript_11382/g.9788 Transcript_11382/m.9788 type:complete len:207 (+) Transcript_11382:79-699(+)
MFVPKNFNKDFSLEQANMASFNVLDITKDEFFNELSKVLSDEEALSIKGKMHEYKKGKTTEEGLFKQFVTVLGKRLTFKAFPFYIATIGNDHTCRILDEFYYRQMLQLPRKNNALIYDIRTYGDLIKKLHFEFEKNIIERIRSGKVNFVEKEFIMDESRIFQLIQIIRRLGNADMAGFKFAINFGLQPHVKQIIHDLLIGDKDLIQ